MQGYFSERVCVNEDQEVGRAQSIAFTGYKSEALVSTGV